MTKTMLFVVVQTSQRDHLLLTLFYNTGARVSEIIGVKVGDVILSESASSVLQASPPPYSARPVPRGRPVGHR
jgi:site-specific recombinase XerD